MPQQSQIPSKTKEPSTIPNEPAPVTHDSGLADLEKVTDYVEEKEIETDNDLSAVAMNFIDAQRNKDNTERQAREQELARITIKREDVGLLINELDITDHQAESALLRSKGDVVQALIDLTN